MEESLESPDWFARRWDILIAFVLMFVLTVALIQREYLVAGTVVALALVVGRQAKLAESSGIKK